MYNARVSYPFIISNDRQARDLEAEIQRVSQALSSEQTLKSIIDGLPELAIEGVRRSLLTEKRELSKKLEAYKQVQIGNPEPMKDLAGSDLGDLLIVARLAQNWKQKDLASVTEFGRSRAEPSTPGSTACVLGSVFMPQGCRTAACEAT